jgi:hypothetical protein
MGLLMAFGVIGSGIMAAPPTTTAQEMMDEMAPMTGEQQPMAGEQNMMGAFSTELRGQGMYAGMEVSGHAIGSLSEGVVMLQVMGLSSMMGEHTYVGWLVNPMSGDKLNVGALKPVGAAGAYSVTFMAGTPLTGSHFTRIEVTNESTMNMSNMADGEVVIAGSL